MTVNRPSSVSLARDVTMSQFVKTGVDQVIIAKTEVKGIRVQASQANCAEQSTSFCDMNVEGYAEGKGHLLQTAFPIARNPERPFKESELRVVIDSGSQ